MGLLRQSSFRLNGPALYFSLRSTIFMGLRGRPRRAPDRCLGDFNDCPLPEVDRAAALQDCNRGNRVTLLVASRWVFEAWRPVSDGWTKKAWRDEPTRLMHHRRTVDLDIPRQVAPLQSLTPLLQASQA